MADFLVVSAVPLTQVTGKLSLGAPRVERIRGWQEGSGFIRTVAPGDVVSIHWDWACDTLNVKRLAALQSWTKREIEVANRTI